ncbi:MAG: hypothetical protein IJ864_05380 [Alphaproteobacteria bacterium]|nr:hypothetical protein [Alphaproteobacteria bacterium]
MSDIKNFVLGFLLSVSGFALYGQLNPSATPEKSPSPKQEIKVSLFKTSDTLPKKLPSHYLFTPIHKESLEIETNIAKQNEDNISPDGIEDDEIINLSMETEEEIPIEIGSPLAEASQAEVLWDENDDKSAMLPDNISDNHNILSDPLFENKTPSKDDSPWVVTKSNSKIKNKILAEAVELQNQPTLFTDNISQVTQHDSEVSYKVAEKIKQSIIFPIPDEILNDENLTPTFIQRDTPSTVQTPINTPAVPVVEKKTVVTKPRVTTPQPSKNNKEDKFLLNSISSWFNDPVNANHQSTTVKKQDAPSYSSLYSKPTPVQKEMTEESKSDRLGRLYESLQATKQAHAQRRILPSELKLSFQPERAEISGTTLQWLKAFSKATFEKDIYLEVRLNANTASELQKRRLNLLYSIFMNNGVDFAKVSTVFSQTEPNALIIRVRRFR